MLLAENLSDVQLDLGEGRFEAVNLPANAPRLLAHLPTFISSHRLLLPIVTLDEAHHRCLAAEDNGLGRSKTPGLHQPQPRCRLLE